MATLWTKVASRAKQLRPQFNLRFLMIAVGLLCCLFAFVGWRYREIHKQARIGRELKRGGVVIWSKPMRGISLLPVPASVYCHYLSDENAELIGQLSFLDCLGLQGAIRDEPGSQSPDARLEKVCHARRLEILGLRQTDITDLGLSYVGRIESIEHLGLRECPKITDDGLKSLESLRLTRLDLTDTRISGEGLEYVGTQLESLYLDGTPITDLGARHLARFQQLEWLQLGDTAITDKALLHIGQLPRLELLDLSGTRITDAGLAHLEDCRSIRHIALPRTGVTDKGLLSLARLPRLDSLILDGTLRR